MNTECGGFHDNAVLQSTRHSMESGHSHEAMHPAHQLHAQVHAAEGAPSGHDAAAHAQVVHVPHTEQA